MKVDEKRIEGAYALIKGRSVYYLSFPDMNKIHSARQKAMEMRSLEN